MATQIEVPTLGESVTQAILVAWHKAEGEAVGIDEPICELETDKANVDVPAKVAGVLHHLKKPGDTVNVGEAIARIDEGGTPKAATSAPQQKTAQAVAAATPTAAKGSSLEDFSPAVRRLLEENHLKPESIP